MNLRISSSRLALLALALTASRAFGDANCVSDISQAGPNGSFCHGSTKPSGDAAPRATPSPAAINQLTGAVGAGLGSILGNALVAPLPNQYKGRVPVKPVVGDDEDVFKTHPIGLTAADDIIGNYTAQDDSYAGKLNHFRELHDAEMDKRRDALELIRGTSAEKWCAAHINILFPTPPASDVLNRYENTVRAYDAEKQTWDKRCGGPSAMPGYESFTEGLAGLKPDAAPASVAKTNAAPKAPAEAEDATAKTSDAKPSSFADAENELTSTPPPAKAHGEATSEQMPPPPAVPDAAPDAPPSDAAPAQSTAGSSDANTNHSTEFFGIKNAKVTQADLQDQRAPDLTSPKLGSVTPSAPGAKVPASVGGKAPSTGEAPLASGTPRMLSAHGAPDVHMEPIIFLRSRSDNPVTKEEEACAASCADAMDNQGAALDRFRAKSVEFPAAIIKGHLQYGLDLAAKGAKQILDKARAGKIGILEDKTNMPDMIELNGCGPGACLGITDEAAGAGTPSLGKDNNGQRVVNDFSTTVSNWLKLHAGREKPRKAPIVFMKTNNVTVDDIFAAGNADALHAAAGTYDAERTTLFENPYYQQIRDEKKADYKVSKKAYEAARDYIHETDDCTSGTGDKFDECMKAQDKAFGTGKEALDDTPLAAAATRVDEARNVFESYVGDLLHTSEDLMKQAINCLGGCP